MEYIVDMFDNEDNWRYIPYYGTIYKINREGIIYNTKSLKFLTNSAIKPTVVLSINRRRGKHVITELVEQAFKQPLSQNEQQH